ncbi:MAG: hypothetical protein U9R57_01525, partial [Thermodesulfobacteriota bacterium]|nr:hypothetical protein [Thermodesulfobacteriota bacterium]
FSPSAVRHSSESSLTCSIFDIRPLMFGIHFLSFVKNENSYAIELSALWAGLKKRMLNIEQGISNIDRNKRRKIKGLSPSAVRHSSESSLTCSIFDIRPLMFGIHFLSFVKNENSYAIKLLTLRSLIYF